MQICPQFSKRDCTAARTAAPMSASSATMKGALPPSSSRSSFRSSAAWRKTSLPARTLPVSVTRRVSGWVTSARPTPSPVPLTTLRTPGGKPAWTESPAISSATVGVPSCDFTTTVLPAMSAGPILRVISAAG